MGKIRINELARELEVKSNVVLEYLVELSIPDKKSHSSALDDDLADKVRAHFRADDGPAPEKAEEAPSAPAPSVPQVETPHPHPGLDLRKLHDFKLDFQPLTRSIADIKATARKAVVRRRLPHRLSPLFRLLPPDRSQRRWRRRSPLLQWNLRWSGLPPLRLP